MSGPGVGSEGWEEIGQRWRLCSQMGGEEAGVLGHSPALPPVPGAQPWGPQRAAPPAEGLLGQPTLPTPQSPAWTRGFRGIHVPLRVSAQ